MEVYNAEDVGQRRIFRIRRCYEVLRTSFLRMETAIRRCVRVRRYILSIDDRRRGPWGEERPNDRWTPLIVLNLCRIYQR